MPTTTLEQAMNDMRHGVYNLTDNGKCTGCGACCSNLLPMTDKEIEVIHRYIKKHNIKERKRILPLSKPVLDLTCPFLDESKKGEKCRIYKVRPAICRCFLCSEPNGAIKHKELLQGVGKPVNVREEFYTKENTSAKAVNIMFFGILTERASVVQ